MTSTPLRPPCGTPAEDPVAASQAYADWLADGSPWMFARPVQALTRMLRAHGYTVYMEGDLSHLTKAVPEDHTPFSATGWPGKSPYPYCMAADIMPPRAGQVSKVTGRPLPSLQRLAARLRSDRASGYEAAGWVKYLNWEPAGDNSGDCWHDSWQPDYVRTASVDRGHIHVSARTDMHLSTVADGYDLAARSEGADTVTLFGCDLSHYDATDFRGAVAEGFTFMTHKAGGDADDPEIGAWWALMKPLRAKVLLGAYWVQYPGNPAGRADAFLARLDATCPGWRDGPFILQADCEKWGGNAATMPGKADIKAFCDRLHAKMPKLAPIVYAPQWAYGDSLTGLGYPLWASSYVTGSGPASTLYPGDTSTRWGAYSGQVPKILQFTSSATIAGQTTCDANAFRGTLAQLMALTAPGWSTDMPLDATDKAWLKSAEFTTAVRDAVVGYKFDTTSAINPNRTVATFLRDLQNFRDNWTHALDDPNVANRPLPGSGFDKLSKSADSLTASLAALTAASSAASAATSAALAALPAIVAAELGPIPGVDPAVLEGAVRRATAAIIANLRIVYDAPVSDIDA